MRGLLGASIVTCAVLYGLLALVLAAVCVVADLPIFVAFVTCIVVIVVQFFIAPWITDPAQRWFHKTTFDAQLPAYPKEFIRKHLLRAEHEVSQYGLH